MDPERRKKKGVVGETSKVKEKVDIGKETEDLKQAESDSKAINDGLQARRESETQNDLNSIPTESIIHNLSKASTFIQQGDELAAALTQIGRAHV